MARNPRRLVPISGQGAHSKPKLVFGGRFDGKVIKKADETMKAKTALEHKKGSELYQRALKEAGIPIISAEAKIAGHGKNRKLYFLQEKVPSEQILSNVFVHASPRECVRLTERLLLFTQKIWEHRKKSSTIFLMDTNFHNWVILNGEPTFLDFYPPNAKKKGSFDKSAIRASSSKLVKLGQLVLYPRQQRRSFDPKNMITSIVSMAILFRPELEQEILKTGREFVRKNFKGREQASLLKRLQSKKTLPRSPSRLGEIAMKLNARAKRKK